MSAPTPAADRARADGYVDPYAGHGSTRDPRWGVYYQCDPVSDEQAIELVRGSPMAAKIVRKIVNEAFRPGFNLEIAERDDLRTAGGDVAGVDERPADRLKREVTAEWRRLNIPGAISQALKWERQFGGAAILLGLNDSQTKPAQKPGRNAKLEWLRVLRSRDLTPHRYYEDPYQEKCGEVELWQLNPSSKNGASSTSSMMLIHESRLVVFGGIRVTDENLVGQLPAFGDSVLMLVQAAVRRYERSLDNTEIVLGRHGEPTWRIEGLAELLSKDKGAGFQTRLAAMERARSALKLRVIDKNDELGASAQPLSGIREIIGIFESDLAAAGDMPVTELFGEAPGIGLGDAGAGPKGVWHANAQAWSNEHAVPPLERISRLLMAGLGGEPVDWKITQPPRAQTSDKEQAELDKLDADTDIAMVSATVITARDVARREKWQLRYQLEAAPDASGIEIPDDIRDPGDADPGDAAASADGKSTEVQATALNGAQVASMVGVITAVVTGQIPREAGAALLAFAFQVKEQGTVQAMLGPVGFKTTTPAPAPKAAPGAPASAPPAPPSPGQAEDEPRGDAADAKEDTKIAARAAVRRAVDAGDLEDPCDLACKDCGHTGADRRHEYDHHKGYSKKNHLKVEAVCTKCHRKRSLAEKAKRQRGDAQLREEDGKFGGSDGSPTKAEQERGKGGGRESKGEKSGAAAAKGKVEIKRFDKPAPPIDYSDAGAARIEAHAAEERAHYEAIAKQEVDDPGPPDDSDVDAVDAYDDSPAGIVREARTKVLAYHAEDAEAAVESVVGEVEERQQEARDGVAEAKEEIAGGRAVIRQEEREIKKLEAKRSAADDGEAADLDEEIKETRASLKESQEEVEAHERALTRHKEAVERAKLEIREAKKGAEARRARAIRSIADQVESGDLGLEEGERRMAALLKGGEVKLAAEDDPANEPDDPDEEDDS